MLALTLVTAVAVAPSPNFAQSSVDIDSLVLATDDGDVVVPFADLVSSLRTNGPLAQYVYGDNGVVREGISLAAVKDSNNRYFSSQSYIRQMINMPLEATVSDILSAMKDQDALKDEVVSQFRGVKVVNNDLVFSEKESEGFKVTGIY